MRFALVEDDKEQREVLLKKVLNVLNEMDINIERADIFSTGEDFLDAWSFGLYDLIILDIYLSSCTGVDIAKRIRKEDSEVQLVFCTTSNEFASESYFVNAIDYLLKPVSEEDIKNTFKKMSAIKNERIRFISLPDGQRIFLYNIIYTEYDNHVVNIYNKNGANIQTRITQSELENILCNSFLISCYKGIIVNLNEVKQLQNDIFLMSNSSTIPISRRKLKDVKEVYTNFIFNKTRKEMVK